MNWGKGITIGIILFMGFIISFVVRAFNNDTDLVRYDYYQHEVNYDKNIESKNNYFELKEKITIEKIEAGIQIQFPDIVSFTKDGSITFYRPQSKVYDRKFDLELDANNRQLLDYNDFVEGFYQITIAWDDKNRSYIFEDDIVF